MSRWTRAWHRYRRQNRFLVGAFLLLLTLSIAAAYLLLITQDASPRELTNRLLLFVLWYLDVSLILVLVFILLRSLVRLAVERRSGVLGSRFRTRLVLTYVVLTFVPIIFIFIIANNFLQHSIDRWFSAPVEAVLRGSAAITEQVRIVVEQRLERQAGVAAHEMAGGAGPERLAALHVLLGVDLLAVHDGPHLVQAITDPRRIPRSIPPLEPDLFLRPGHRADRWRGGLIVRAWAPVAGTTRTVVVGDMLPRDVLLLLEQATAAHATFQEMKLERGTISSTAALVFLAVTLALLFATVWVGLYVSRRFTEPLLAVAAATQRVAEGDDLEEVAVPASDEVAILVSSFNAMVRRVREKEEQLLASNSELATLLATVPTGVLTIDPSATFFRPNAAAARILGQPSWSGQWWPMQVLGEAGLAPLLAALAAAVEAGQQVQLRLGASVRHLEVSAKPLPGGGRVVALDDLTQLMRAQRQAAWSEVARRIAHEIKNPLTPIRLTAERIQRRADGLDTELRQVVVDGCEAIVAHVAGLKELVDAFHHYARMPAVNPQPTVVARLLREVGALYQGLRAGLVVETELPCEVLTAEIDPVLVRQALVNLLDNAVEAITGRGLIRLSAVHQADNLTVIVEDSGVGLPSEDPDLLAQPFYSTKGRGSGMGLAVVHRIAADHGGHLEAENRAGGGAVLRLVLPGVVRNPPGDDGA